MIRGNQPKHKICRKAGFCLWANPKCPASRGKTHFAGEHGRKNYRRSDYYRMLFEKQKLRYTYNITEKQFRRTYNEAVKVKGDTTEGLIGLLERRLDAVVYRMKFVPTVFSSRQFINHGHVTVNGKKVNIPSYLVKDGDVIEVREKSRDIPMVMEAVVSPERDLPDYMDVDLKKMKGTYVRQPMLADVPYPVQMEPNLVIEFYSR